MLRAQLLSNEWEKTKTKNQSASMLYHNHHSDAVSHACAMEKYIYLDKYTQATFKAFCDII